MVYNHKAKKSPILARTPTTPAGTATAAAPAGTPVPPPAAPVVPATAAAPLVTGLNPASVPMDPSHSDPGASSAAAAAAAAASEGAVGQGIVENPSVDVAESTFDRWVNSFDRFDEPVYNPNSHAIQTAGYNADQYDHPHWDTHYNSDHIRNAGHGANHYNRYDSYNHYKHYNPRYPVAADQTV
jgi:hypothetical protein